MASDKSFWQRFTGAIGAIFDAIGRFFGSLFQSELQIETNIEAIYHNFEKAKSDIEEGIEKLRNFEFDPKWKQRVINVPAAVERIKKIYTDNFSDFKGRLQTFSDPIHQFKLIWKAETQAGGSMQEAPAKLSRAAIKVDEIATLIAQLKTASDTALQFAELFDQIISDIQTLDPIFLQQSNPRKRLSGKPLARVGKLHRT